MKYIFSKLFGYATKDEMSGICMGEDSCKWIVDSIADPERFFIALKEVCPAGENLALHDPTEKLALYLKENKAKNKTRVEMGTIWPKSNIFHIECTVSHLEKLTDLSSKHTS